MRKLAVTAISLVIIAALYCGATWYSAVLVTQRSNQMLTSISNRYKVLADQYKDMIKVVSRKVNTRFFGASEDITLEFSPPLLKDLIKNDAEHNQFVIHNDIAFGPLPNFRSFGLATIETSLILSDKQKQSLIKAVGTDKPVRFVTTMGYFSKTHLEIISVPLEFHADGSEEHGTWKGGKLQLSFSDNLDAAEFDGDAPGLIFNGKNNSVVHLDNITLNGTVQRKFDVLFTGDETLGIEAISFSDPSKTESDFSVKNIKYGIRASADDQFINFGVIADSDALSYKNTNLKAINFDFATNHLDAKSVASLHKSIQDMQTRILKQHDAGDDSSQATEAFKKQAQQDVLAVLQHSPVLSLDNIGFATNDGALNITGKATLDNVTEEDVMPEVLYQALAKKIHAQVDVSIEQPLIDHWPVAQSAEQIKQQIAALETQGFIARKGSKLESHIEYKDGKITANGKQVGG